MKQSLLIMLSLTLLSYNAFSQDSISKKELKKTYKNYLLQNRPWTIEVPLWLPGFSGSFAYGDVSVEGEDGQDIENPIGLPGFKSSLRL